MTYSDGRLIQMTVVSLVVLETLFVALSIHSLNHYLIINYFNPLALLKNVWSLDISYGIIASNVLIVHLSYAYRIYHVSGRKALIPIAVVIVALIHFSLGWVLVAVLFRLSSVEQIPGLPETLGKAILSSAAAIDITIASTLSYYLHKKRTGFKQTDKLINRLIKYTINNGILTR
ncbi:hypothetical protein JR316_0006448 [Psilocybe cubensis]|uniref:Uncharacterized protein n=1 Tax=Psilocybe cubensis TaxID=181762 RepID=A0ACB8H2A8_PSICU|nr:hypothetical protein JR316_0006448 [Psilocybe cubensis]KAH9481918.1 hypothetical protein JR316_0006448 [Psilocybe cubensis]